MRIKNKIIPLLREMKENGRLTDYRFIKQKRKNFDLWFKCWIEAPINLILKEMGTY